jgi:hypothetical protein
MMGDVRDFIYGAIECVLIRMRRFRESAELPNELKRRCANLVVGRGRRKIMQGLNVSAHEESLTADYADENGFSLLSTFQPLNNSTSAVGVLRIAILSVARNHGASSAVIQFPNM